MKKNFLISIDAEGDDFWTWVPGQVITTENAKYVYRFQKLCDKYGFKPTYLTNYEIACDEEYVKVIKPALEQGRCEVGMHLHAWNCPPLYELEMREDIRPGECSYLIEYPTNIMDEKIAFMTSFLEEKFGVKPVVHRAGRWATDERYFHLLEKHGYIADCSVAPGMDMRRAKGFTEGSSGSDYSKYSHYPYFIEGKELLEVPTTVRTNHSVKKDSCTSIKRKIRNYYRAIKGRGPIWLRPNGNNLEELLYLVDLITRGKEDYLMFMLHTSEMMPKGSPVFKTDEQIEKLYEDLEKLFAYISRNYEGCTIGEYAKEYIDKSKG